ncbi:MAG: hypothetical protein HN976_36120 [Lentisphaerae bacterium]|nr:hypothetical protein [Lentisphaerota bacterium]
MHHRALFLSMALLLAPSVGAAGVKLPYDRTCPVIHTNDGGKTWAQLDAGVFLSPGIVGFGIRFDPVEPRRLFVFDNMSAWEVWDLATPGRRSQ